ncbi:Intracellular ribonuclease LX [Linum perenne]
MRSHWPQLLGPQPPHSNWEFWFYEWNKHGRVSGLIPVEYFKQTIVASRAIRPPLDSLRVAGIVPSNSLIYTASTIKTAILSSAALNLNPTLSCEVYGPKKFILKEIFFCFNKALTPITGFYLSLL